VIFIPLVVLLFIAMGLDEIYQNKIPRFKMLDF